MTIFSNELDQMVTRDSGTVRNAIETIDGNAKGICFVVNDNYQLQGVLTDGDIRRALLAGSTLEAPIRDILRPDFVALPVDISQEEITSRLDNHIRFIPLVDGAGKLVDFAHALRSHRIPIAEPILGGNEAAYVNDCLRTVWISSQGKYVRRFEEMLAEYHAMPHALAVSNGTVALHLGLLALGIGPGDEVIVPDFTFAASVNAVLHCGATPVFVDIDPSTWCMDPEQLEAAISKDTKAIMPVHLYGYVCDMEKILDVARRFGISVIEDAAEALGSSRSGIKAGSFGDVSTFSFFGNKTITTGEGGAVLFRDKDLYDFALTLRDHGMSRTKRYWHEYVGYNYRMTNLQAAVGVGQFERVDEILARKSRIGAIYRDELAETNELILPPEEESLFNSYWLFSVRLNKAMSNLSPEDVIGRMMLNGIECRPLFYPLHEMPPYRSFSTGSFPVTSDVSRSGFSLPSSPALGDDQIREVAGTLKTILKTRSLLSS